MSGATVFRGNMSPNSWQRAYNRPNVVEIVVSDVLDVADGLIDDAKMIPYVSTCWMASSMQKGRHPCPLLLPGVTIKVTHIPD